MRRPPRSTRTSPPLPYTTPFRSRRRGRRFGGPENHGTARGKRRAELPRRGHQRHVPRGDRPHHADGMARREGVDAGVHRDRATAQLVGERGEPVIILRVHADVAARFAHRPAIVAGFDFRSEASRVGKGLFSTVSSWWLPYY